MEYAIIYTPGPRWSPGVSPDQQQLGQHNQHLQALRSKRKLLQGGSFDKHGTRVVVLEVSSEADAEELLRQDPGVASGVLKAELRPWHIVFGLQAGVSRPTPI